MSSSISSSDASIDAAPAWGRWLTAFLGALALGCALIFAIVLIVDPYDSGRAGLTGIKGVNDASPRTANARDRKSTRLNSSHTQKSRMPSSA